MYSRHSFKYWTFCNALNRIKLQLGCDISVISALNVIFSALTFLFYILSFNSGKRQSSFGVVLMINY